MNDNPKSKLWLCKTNLENDYKNTLTFSSVDAQRNYFIGNPLEPFDYGVSTKSYTDFTYLRLEQFIKVPDFIEDIDTNNYLVLVNDTKYYYYFITSMQYIDDETTRINIELDVMQTYFFDITYKNTFVEREHVSDDTAGKHTLPEGLELGEFVQAGDPINLNSYNTGTYICIQSSELLPEVDFDDIKNRKTINGIYQGCYFMICTDELNASNLLEIYDKKGKGNAIVSVFLVPKEFAISEVTTGIIGTAEGINFSFLVPTSSSTYNTLVADATFNRNTTIDGYTPRNKKLLTFPFNYFNISNNNGTNILMHYEDFTSGTPHFKIIGDISPGCSIKCVPLNYKKVTDNNSMKSFDYGVVGGKFPTCSWNSDAYTNWLTQNGLNNTVQTIIGSGQALLGAASGNTPLMINGLTGVYDVMKQKHMASFMPDQAKGNTSCGDVIYSTGNNVFTCYKMCVRKEIAECIDGFFDMYGYQTNLVKTPSIHTRLNWNYIKTRECNFTGNIPQQYMTRIKGIFDNGITFWHNPSTMLDYSQSNTILS